MVNKDEFIQKIANEVNKQKWYYGIQVTSPIVAQAILESAWGQSVLSRAHFNFFGLKCGSSYKGLNVNMATKEVYNGKTVSIRDYFRAYTSLAEGIKGYFEFISTKRYSALKTCVTPEDYLDAIVKAGYATSPTYKKNLLAVIDLYGLRKYDGVFPEAVATGYFPKPTHKFTSIVDAFNYIGMKSSYKDRESIFVYNFRNMYHGSAAENTILVKALYAGNLKIPV